MEQRVRELVAERRAADPAPDDPFRGLYLTDDAVDVLLHSGPAAVVGVNQDQLTELDAEAEQIEQSGADIRLRRDAALTPLDVELLMVALLPDLDSRFERLYGYLNDDVTRRRALGGSCSAACRGVGAERCGALPTGVTPAAAGEWKSRSGPLRAEGRG